MIWITIGGAMTPIDYDVFTETHYALGDHFHRLGLRGDELDAAIARALPDALAWALYGDRATFH